MRQDYLQMKVLELAPQVYVSGQVFEQDLKLAVDQGVRTIVNNRPDGEATGQPRSADLERAARELGMAYVYFPVVPGRITPDDVSRFAGACDGLERPMLLFCRTGARSAALWQMCEDAAGR